jgi:hypothetical protein
LVELLTITVQAFFWFVDIGGIVASNINKAEESLNSDGQQFYQYQQTKRKLEQ